MRSPFRTVASLILLTTLIVTAAANAQNSANADAAYDGWLRAYLVRSGSQTYFVNTLTDRSRAFFWGQAWMIWGVEDAYEKNHAADRKQLISDLLNTLLVNETSSWSWDTWNDDVAWAVIATIRGYQITGNTAYRDAAVQNWNMVYNRGWDSTFDGGIWELMDDRFTPSGNKGGLSNWTMVIAGAHIYQSTGDASILTKSKAIYAWCRTHCYDANTGRVYEGWGYNGIAGDDNTYNSGLLLQAANALYKITGDAMYYNDALKVIGHVTARYPILTEDHPANGSFGSEQFVRGLSQFAARNNLWNTYWQYLENNCASAWNHRRTDYNVSWNNWAANTPTSNLAAMEVMGSVVLQAVTQISPISGTHIIVSKQNGITIDNGSSTADGAGVMQWGWNGGAAQQWIFRQNSDTSWNIINKLSGKALDDPNSSLANGTQMVQWTANGGNNQRWWVDQQSDGSYKIWNKASSAALDNSSSSVNGFKLIQWAWNGGTQQRWLLQ